MPDDHSADAGQQPRRDHRAAVQAQKLRMTLATKAVRHGDMEPSMTPVGTRILVISMIIGCVILVGTIVTARLLQML